MCMTPQPKKIRTNIKAPSFSAETLRFLLVLATVVVSSYTDKNPPSTNYNHIDRQVKARKVI